MENNDENETETLPAEENNILSQLFGVRSGHTKVSVFKLFVEDNYEILDALAMKQCKLLGATPGMRAGILNSIKSQEFKKLSEHELAAYEKEAANLTEENRQLAEKTITHEEMLQCAPYYTSC